LAPPPTVLYPRLLSHRRRARKITARPHREYAPGHGLPGDLHQPVYPWAVLLMTGAECLLWASGLRLLHPRLGAQTASRATYCLRSLLNDVPRTTHVLSRSYCYGPANDDADVYAQPCTPS